MRRLLTGLLSATLVLGACGDDDDGDRAAVTSIPDETSSSTTTEPPVPPPDVIPTDLSLITEEYVEQILDALYEVNMRALIHVRDEGKVGENAISLISAIYTPTATPQQVNELVDLSYGPINDLHPNPRPLDVNVIAILEKHGDCIVAEVTTDASRLVRHPAPAAAEQRDFIRLLRADESQPNSNLNPTAWWIDLFPITLDGSAPDGLSCQ